MIALPPSNGAPNETVTCAFPATTVGAVGALGTVFGTTLTDAVDIAPVPFAFVALTVQVYDFPFVRPETRIGELAPVFDPAAPPFDDAHATLYPLMGLPPLNGATNNTVNCPLPTPAVGCPAAFGTVLGMTAADAGDEPLGPFMLVAVTVHE